MALFVLACVSCGGGGDDARSACAHLSEDCGMDLGMSSDECATALDGVIGGPPAFAACMYRCLSTVSCDEEDPFRYCADDEAPGPKCEQLAEDL